MQPSVWMDMKYTSYTHLDGFEVTTTDIPSVVGIVTSNPSKCNPPKKKIMESGALEKQAMNGRSTRYGNPCWGRVQMQPQHPLGLSPCGPSKWLCSISQPGHVCLSNPFGELLGSSHVISGFPGWGPRYPGTASAFQPFVLFDFCQTLQQTNLGVADLGAQKS